VETRVGTGAGAGGGCTADPGAELLLLVGWTLSKVGDSDGAGDPVTSGVAGGADGLERGPGAEDPLACGAGDRCLGAERAAEGAADALGGARSDEDSADPEADRVRESSSCPALLSVCAVISCELFELLEAVFSGKFSAVGGKFPVVPWGTTKGALGTRLVV
jgi:hypothetical protein